MMECDHPSCIPVGPLVGELWQFKYFPTWRPSASFWILKILIFDHVTVIVVLICCCVPTFNKISSPVRPPDAHNCWMYNAPLLGIGHCHGNSIMGTCWGHDGMRPPKFHPNRSIDRRVIALPTFCNMATVRHLECEFCYSGPPTKSNMRFDCPVKVWCWFDNPRRRYYNFIILPFWLKNA